jgi:type I restriction enzyme S subunit
MNTELIELPPNWKWTTLGEIADVVGGGTPKTNEPSNYEGGTIPWITPADLSGYTAKHISHGARFITKKGLEESSAKMMPAGTVLFTSRAPIGYVVIASNPVCTNQGFKSFVLKEGVLPDYVYWWLKGSKDLAESMASGTTFLELSGAKAKQLPIPIAPLDQQKHIIAEIEKQFSRLDEAVANLKRVKANLKRYKAAVLKAAVEGRLVETEAELARRAAQGSANVAGGRMPGATEGRSYETGAQLLQRILETRRSQWKGKGKYKEPTAPDTADLPELPEGWAWSRLDSIAALKGGITVDSKRKDSTARSVPYLRVANVQRGYLDLSEVKFIDAPESDIKELRLQRGDILFNEGGDRDKLGRGWIWDGQLADCIHQNHVFRARLFLSEVSPKLVSWWGNSFGKDYFLREGKQTTNLASINLTKLSAFPVPLPPAAEQHRIVAEVGRRLSIADEIEAQINADARRADRLRQSILALAFKGEIICEYGLAKKAMFSNAAE